MGANPAVFYNMDENGLLTGNGGADPAISPTLVVTEGYIRLHILQANGTGDANGGNVILRRSFISTRSTSPLSVCCKTESRLFSN